MNIVMAELAKEHPQVSSIKLEAKAVPDISLKNEISSQLSVFQEFSEN